MARNEEKQLGKLNRLWLQKEREEGRIKNVHEDRPKLCTLNTATAVKKWIPSIKNEMEYYLQQCQLPHYPERKIAEFQRHIDELKKEYQLYLRKLRALDPSSKHHPWTPRAYTKKRQNECDPQCVAHKIVKMLYSSEPSAERMNQERVDCAEKGEGGNEKITRPQGHQSSQFSDCTPLDLPDQDQPLSFNTGRMPLNVARSRAARGGLPMDTTVRTLLSGLPNLNGSPLAEAAKRTSPTNLGVDKFAISGHIPQGPSHVLGLDCYSSSDEDT